MKSKFSFKRYVICSLAAVHHKLLTRACAVWNKMLLHSSTTISNKFTTNAISIIYKTATHLLPM